MLAHLSKHLDNIFSAEFPDDMGGMTFRRFSMLFAREWQAGHSQ